MSTDKTIRCNNSAFCRDRSVPGLAGRQLCFWVLILLFIGSAVGPTLAAPGDDRPLILTTIHPLSLIAEDIAGDWADVRQLLPEGELPHHFSLKMSHRRLLDQADLLLWVGPELEGFLQKAIDGRGLDGVITATARKPLAVPGTLQSAPAGEPGVLSDPHVWLDPEWGIAIAVAVADWLVQHYPEQQDAILTALTQLTNEVRLRVSALAAEFDLYGNRRFISDHDAFSHFARRFGLASAGSLHDDSGLLRGAAGLAKLRQQRDVACVVAEPRYEAERVEALARDLGVATITIDPLGSALSGSYLSLLNAVADGFRRCFAPGGDGAGD